MSIRLKLTIFLGILGLFAVLLMAGMTRYFMRQAAMEEAKNKGEIIYHFAMSVRDHLKFHQWPIYKKVLDKDRFFPELQSGSAVTRSVDTFFSKKVKGFQFREASTDPFLLVNRATDQEILLINKFHEHPELEGQSGFVKRFGEDYFFKAYPLHVSQPCLKCHGEPAKAPADIIQRYGTERGFNWKIGQTPGTFIVYVPLGAALADAQTATWRIVLAGGVGVFLLLVSLWLYVGTTVCGPVARLAQTVNEISLGRNLEVKLTTTRKDEVGNLTQAVERLRASSVKLMDQLSKIDDE